MNEPNRSSFSGFSLKNHVTNSPFVIMFQQIEVIAERNSLTGMIWGPSFDTNVYWKAVKK